MAARALASVAVRRLALRAPTMRVASCAPLRAVPSRTLRPFHSTQYVAAGAAETFLDKATVTDRVITVVKNFEKVDPTKVVANARFKEDLALDSLDAVELVMAVEDEFAIEIPDAEADKILSVQDAVDFVASHPMAK